MLWHAKALETLTDAFNVVQSMQEEVDLADFRNTLFRSGTLASLDGDHIQASACRSVRSSALTFGFIIQWVEYTDSKTGKMPKTLFIH